VLRSSLVSLRHHTLQWINRLCQIQVIPYRKTAQREFFLEWDVYQYLEDTHSGVYLCNLNLHRCEPWFAMVARHLVQPFLPRVGTTRQYAISIEPPLRLRVMATASVKTLTPFFPHLHAPLGLRSLRFRRVWFPPVSTVHLTEHGTRFLSRILPASTGQSHHTNQSGAL
jgi:hypothetical protein